MLQRLLRADLARGAAVALTLTALIALACALASASARIIVDTTSATNQLARRANLPDLVQMHSGELDAEEITAWASSRPEIVDHEIIKSLPAPRTELWIGGTNQADSFQEPAFVTAPKRIDLLMGDDGRPADPGPGEIALPIHYSVTGAARIGDTITVGTGEAATSFRVTGFFRDAQMNAAMIPSKRLVVSPEDFEVLAQRITEPEYFIEFDLTDSARPGSVIAAYNDAGLPNQGIHVDASMIRLMSALSTQLIAVVAVLVALVLAAVSVLALRYTVLAALEADLAQIAVLKAIGAAPRRIARLYMAKYLALSAIGAIIGYGAGLPLGASLEAPALAYLGTPPTSVWTFGLPLAAVLVLAGIVISLTRLTLRRMGRISTVEALRAGASGAVKARRHRWLLSHSRRVPSLQWLGIRQALRPTNILLLGVLALSTTTMLIPLNIASTLDNPSIATYLGAGEADLRIDVRGGDEDLDATRNALEADPRIERSTRIQRRSYEMLVTNDKWEPLLIDIGDHDAFPMKYLSGRGPASADEVSLSYSQAEAAGAQEGSTVTVRGSQGEQAERSLTVTGVYQDITNNGLTAKALFDDGSPALWRLAYADVRAGEDASAVAEDLRSALPEAQVTSSSQHASQFFGATGSQVRLIAIMTCAVALALSFLITTLFVVLILTRERDQVSTMQALGAPLRSIQRHYLTRFGIIAVIGLIIGIVLALFLGDIAVSAIMASRGAPGIELLPEAWVVGLMIPAAVIITTAAAIGLALRRLPTAPLRTSE